MRLLERISVCVLLALLCIGYFGNPVVHAFSKVTMDLCQDNVDYSGTISGVYAIYEPNSQCPSNGDNALILTYLTNCDSVTHDAQTDTWQTQVTNSAGTRYAETGRSNRVTYPTDCNWYFVQQSYLSSPTQLPDPSYGCVWVNVFNIGSLDYQCGQFPLV